MPSSSPTKLPNHHQKLGLPSPDIFSISLCRALVIGGAFSVFFFVFLLYYPTCQSEIFSPIQHIWVSPPPSQSQSLSPSPSSQSQSQSSPSPNPNPSDHLDPPTNVTHIVFGIVGSVKGWRTRKPYIESWWKPNVTHGYLYLDVPPPADLLPWPASSPPYRISENNTKLLAITHHNPTMVRIARGLLETFKEEDHHKAGVRWIVMGDDDSIFFLENMVEVLRKYDHNEYVYIGGHSESALPNFIHSFEMGFGGAGVVFSYPLAAALVPRLDECIMRYPMLYAADQMWQSCLADLGVYLNHEKGIHQIDLRGDISGLLSAHPPAPLISLHHPEKVEPYFPKMDRHQSVNHLMKAAKVDQSRMLQQTICYHRQNKWSFSVSWGYSTHIYENIFPRSILQKPLETFKPWVLNVRPPLFIFNTRIPKKDPCEAPHIFFFRSVQSVDEDRILTMYTRAVPRRLPACLLSGNHSADHISEIQVLSPKTKLTLDNRRECCDVEGIDDGKGNNVAHIKYRACVKDEVIG